MNPKERVEICEFILTMKRHEDFAEQVGLFNRTKFNPEREVDRRK